VQNASSVLDGKLTLQSSDVAVAAGCLLLLLPLLLPKGAKVKNRWVVFFAVGREKHPTAFVLDVVFATRHLASIMKHKLFYHTLTFFWSSAVLAIALVHVSNCGIQAFMQ